MWLTTLLFQIMFQAHPERVNLLQPLSQDLSIGSYTQMRQVWYLAMQMTGKSVPRWFFAYCLSLILIIPLQALGPSLPLLLHHSTALYLLCPPSPSNRTCLK